MNFFDANRLLAAVFTVGVFIVGIRLLSDQFYKVQHPIQPAYLLEGLESRTAPTVVVQKDVVEDIAPLMASASIEAGKAVARKCLQCHGFESSGKNKIGPNLWHMVDKEIAAVPGFSYSKAFKALKGKWTVQELNKFLAKPRDYVPGTKMTFAGVKKPEDRANLVAYMQSMSSF